MLKFLKSNGLKIGAILIFAIFLLFGLFFNQYSLLFIAPIIGFILLFVDFDISLRQIELFLIKQSLKIYQNSDHSKIASISAKFLMVLLGSEYNLHLIEGQSIRPNVIVSGNKRLGLKQKSVSSQYLLDFIELCEIKRRKFVNFSLGLGSSVAISTVVLLFAVYFFNPFYTSASTFGFVQETWAGIASTTAYATHSSNRSGWTGYYSKDAGVNASTNLSLDFSTTTVTHNGLSGFTGGTLSNLSLIANGSNGFLQLTGSDYVDNWSTRLKSNYVTSTDDIFIDGNYAYIAGGAKSLAIIDITDKSNPALAGFSTTTTATKAVYVSGNYAYLAADTTGVLIFDITNKAAPVIVSTYNTPGTALDVKMVNDYVYVADGAGDLQIFSVANKSAPTTTASLALSGTAQGIYVTGGYVYVVSDAVNDVMSIVNVSNPAAPSLSSIYSYAGAMLLNVHVDGNYAYLAASGALYILDVSNKTASSTLVGSALVGSGGHYSARDVMVAGNYAYVADGDAGLAIVDITTKASPFTITNYNTALASSVFVSGNYAYIGDDTGGLYTFDITTPYVNLDLLKTYSSSTFGTPVDIETDGRYAYIIGSRYVTIMDISDESNPTFVSRYDTTNTGTLSGKISGNYLYLARTSGLRIVDVTNKSAATTTGGIVTATSVYKIYISGNYAYLANYTAGLTIVDISNKAVPVVTGSVDLYSEVTDVVVNGNYAYTIGGADYNIQVVNVTDKANPVANGIFGAGYIFSAIYLKDNLVYVASTIASDSLISVYDASGGAVLQLLDSYTSVRNIQNIEVVGNNLYFSVSTPGGGVYVIDVSDPYNIKYSSSYQASSTLNVADLSVIGNNIFTVSGAANTLNIFSAKRVPTTGSFTSSILDMQYRSSLATTSWTTFASSSVGSVAVKIRSSNNADMSGATAWASCNALVSGALITSSNCVTASDRYLQYYFDVASSNSSYSPKIFDFSYGYVSYLDNQSLISSAFNSENSGNLVADLSWTENLGLGTDVKFQIRTAPDNGGQPGAWTDWLGPTGTSTYYSTASGRNTINTAHKDGLSDQWVQYRVYLMSDGRNTPTADSIRLTYVSNVPPEFESTATAEQRISDGKVEIKYKARDLNTADVEAVCQNCVVPSFEYSSDGGATWNAITAGLALADISTTTIGAAYVATTTVVWDAKAQLDGVYSNNFKVRVILDDREGTNNLGTSETAIFVGDFKNPAITNYGITVIATTSPATVLLNATDDSTGLQMCITLANTQTNCVAYNATSSIALATNPDVVYVKFVDKYQNITSAEAATPEMPTNIMIRDNSDLVNAVYQEFLAWKAVGLPFNKYQVWYSTDNVNFSLAGEVDNRATNYYFHQGLSLSQIYYYKITVEDERGNVSYYSSVVSDTVDGTGGTDTIPPVISNVEVISTTTQSAVIEWDTNQFSNSQIHLSTVPGNFTETIGSVTMADTPDGLGRHHVVVNNLLASTTYYFSVESVNTLGISATDNNGGDGYTFNTKSGPIISGVTASQITNNSATIIWNTDIAGDSYVVYSSSSNFATYQEAGSGDSTTFHSVNLTSLTKGVTYYYYVRSGVATNDNGGLYFTFATAVDDVAPVITAATTTVATDNKALINWTTNELATSLVEYGIVNGVYDQSVSDANLSTYHSILLPDLTTSTTYYYRVLSSDASGNLASSTGYSFTTLERLSTETNVILREELAFNSGYASSTANSTTTVASTTCPVCSSCGGGGGGSSIDRSLPQIKDIKIVEVAQDGAKISWTTNKNTNSFIEYGVTSAYGFWQGIQTASTTHVIAITNLTPATTYNYRINSTDEYGNLGLSDNQTFKTDGISELTNIETGTSTTGVQKDAVLAATVNKAMELVSGLAMQVSVGALESALGSQYNLIRQLSQMVPAPLLGGEPRVTLTADTATITWSTDKDSNSLVALAPNDQYDPKKGDDAYTQVIGNPDELVKNHVVVLSGLMPDVIYDYQVRSMSSIGSISKSPNFVFKTKSRELEISNYTVERVSDSQATFRWLTSAETDATVKYTPYRNGVLAIGEQRSEKVKSFSTIHEISVEEFESGVAYEIELSGKDSSGIIINKKIPAFSTGEDNYPPSIYQVQTESAIFPGKDSNIQTIIYWLTNEPATGQVFYRKGVSNGTDGEWEKTPLEASYAKKHVVVITKFEPGSIYQFKIESTDSAGNLTISKIFTILAPKQKDSVFQVIIKNFEDVFGWTKQLGL